MIRARLQTMETTCRFSSKHVLRDAGKGRRFLPTNLDRFAIAQGVALGSRIAAPSGLRIWGFDNNRTAAPTGRPFVSPGHRPIGADIARPLIAMLMVLTPKALRNIARGWRLCAYPGRPLAPRVAAEKTRQPWAISHNAFGVALVAKVGAYRASPRAVTPSLRNTHGSKSQGLILERDAD